MTDDSAPIRIGLVLVHGVGEQRRFDHLSAEVRHLVAGLSHLGARASIDARSTQDSEVGAEHESWHAGLDAPVKIHVTYGSPTQRLCLCLHEVWWADLDDKATLWNRIKFWVWGLGFWWVKKFNQAKRTGGQMDMVPPVFPPFAGGNALRELIVRGRLWTFANVFLLSALTVNLLNYLLRRLKLGELPSIEVFYQFVGDVKLYQDRERLLRGPLPDLNCPRRVAIRRRMVQVLVDAYRADYDRWYVLAHSLGTVVALNGVMETAHTLPNFLSQEVWSALKAANDPVLGPRTDGQERPVHDMWPTRPVWITDDDEVLHRDVLFRKLRGLLTYGSPLDKFAYLWCQIVNINKDPAPWRQHNGQRQMPFEWINVYEHTDPVSASLAAYKGPGIPEDSPEPKNYAYKASWMLLLSHLAYLKLKGQRNDQFVLRLLEWVLGGQNFPAPERTDRSWYRSQSAGFGLLLRTPMWLAGTLIFVVALAYAGVPAVLELLLWLASVPWLDGSALQRLLQAAADGFASLGFEARAFGVLGASVLVVTLAGIARRILERKL